LSAALNHHKARSSNEMVSGGYSGRGGIKITRTRHNVTLYVHCLSCSFNLLHLHLGLTASAGTCK